MKKVLSLSIMALALIAFASTSALAGPNCSSDKAVKTSDSKSCCASKTNATKASADGKTCASKTNATKASADGKACSAHGTNATKASADGKACSQADIEACAKKLGVSVEECKKMCSEKGSMTMHTISIKGMTCASCENSVTTAIEAVAGVNKVVSISHKDGSAVVCVDKKGTCLTTLTKAITDKGFKAEIIPAVATTSTISADGKKACSKSCSPAEKAACDAKDAKKVEDTK